MLALPSDMCHKISAGVDGGLSRGSSVHCADPEEMSPSASMEIDPSMENIIESYMMSEGCCCLWTTLFRWWRKLDALFFSSSHAVEVFCCSWKQTDLVSTRRRGEYCCGHLVCLHVHISFVTIITELAALLLYPYHVLVRPEHSTLITTLRLGIILLEKMHILQFRLCYNLDC